MVPMVRATLWLAMSAIAVPPPPAAPPGSAEPHPEPATLAVDGGAIQVVVPGALAGPARTALLAFVERSAHAVGAWYGRFPAAALRIDVSVTDGAKIGPGTTWPGTPPHLALGVGARIDRAGYDRDWVLVHELIHLAFPPVADRHH
ncbi:MAG: hypothetical protein ABMB14_38055, partial [Myxococcota bacterium]